MKTISVSTDVFAKIWALRLPGEDTEDEILRRQLSCKEPSTKIDERRSTAKNSGFYSKRFNVNFTQGFEIFRNFKGKEYSANAINGNWVLKNTGETFRSLSDLSRAIGVTVENVWVNWLFKGEDGSRRQIAELRDPATISRRTK